MTVQKLNNDDLFLISNQMDIELHRQAPYTRLNPLPYSIVAPHVLTDRLGLVFWPDRPAFWDTYKIPSGALPTRLDDDGWSIEGLYRRWIEPIVFDSKSPATIRNCHILATTLVFAELVIDAVEKFLSTEGYLVRWRPIEQHFEIPVYSRKVSHQRVFTIDPFYSELAHEERIDWLESVRNAQCLDIQMKLKKGMIATVPQNQKFIEPDLETGLSAFPLNSTEGLIIGSVYSATPRF
ncbi:hypothetical protein [Reinekea sp. G2M2-21]|uniref:hypothetical protein n=1 Tax=Reinekea sp. G2M2-21 TaxID=2788942 RepID=UPI0018AB8E8D|nr:hypothetical protein [Reinekea sp. G2M2-21]